MRTWACPPEPDPEGITPPDELTLLNWRRRWGDWRTYRTWNNFNLSSYEDELEVEPEECRRRNNRKMHKRALRRAARSGLSLWWLKPITVLELLALPEKRIGPLSTDPGKSTVRHDNTFEPTGPNW